MRLNEMPLKKATVITDIDWSALPPEIGRRLRDLGFHKGAEVELQHFAPISRDPIACRVDRILMLFDRRRLRLFLSKTLMPHRNQPFRKKRPLPDQL